MSTGLRSARERLVQTLAFEAGGLLLVAPLCALATGSGAGESLGLVAALAAVVMAWSAFYNTVFDAVEHRLAGRGVVGGAGGRPRADAVVRGLRLRLPQGLRPVAAGGPRHGLMPRARAFAADRRRALLEGAGAAVRGGAVRRRHNRAP